MLSIGFMFDFIGSIVPGYDYEYYTNPKHVHEFLTEIAGPSVA